VVYPRPGRHGAPLAVDRADRFEDWEGDTIVRKKHQSTMATMAGRKSLFTIITLLDHRGPTMSPNEFINVKGGLLCRTVYFDIGREFEGHQSPPNR
jgi:IS30 family transposase